MPMVFPTSPIVGQVFTESGRSWVWNGSAWDAPTATNTLLAPYGLELIRTVNFTNVASVSIGSNADPVFSSAYDNYRIILSSRNATDAARAYLLRLRANTTDETTALYNVMNQGIDRVGANFNTAVVNGTSANIVAFAFYLGERSSASFDLMNPFLAERTTGLGVNQGIDANHYNHQSFSFLLATNTSYNGFTLLNSSGNFIDGRVSIYGYRK